MADDGDVIENGTSICASEMSKALAGSKESEEATSGNQDSNPKAAKQTYDGVPFVGLVNQGTTCYLNSLIQALYMTPEFRDMVWNWSTEQLVPKSLPYELQRLFILMRKTSQLALETKDLTMSFGWDSSYSSQQHDVQELWRIMFDALEKCFQNKPEAELIKELYEGEMVDYVKCLKCNTVKSRPDKFQDVPLTLKPFGSETAYETLENAIQGFIEPERLDGANQYFCSNCNEKCDADKGLAFTKLPYILTIQLKRFDYDFRTMQRVKLDHKLTFPEYLNMQDYLLLQEESIRQNEDKDKEKSLCVPKTEGNKSEDENATRNGLDCGDQESKSKIYTAIEYEGHNGEKINLNRNVDAINNLPLDEQPTQGDVIHDTSEDNIQAEDKNDLINETKVPTSFKLTKDKTLKNIIKESENCLSETNLHSNGNSVDNVETAAVVKENDSPPKKIKKVKIIKVKKSDNAGKDEKIKENGLENKIRKSSPTKNSHIQEKEVEKKIIKVKKNKSPETNETEMETEAKPKTKKSVENGIEKKLKVKADSTTAENGEVKKTLKTVKKSNSSLNNDESRNENKSLVNGDKEKSEDKTEITIKKTVKVAKKPIQKIKTDPIENESKKSSNVKKMAEMFKARDSDSQSSNSTVNAPNVSKVIRKVKKVARYQEDCSSKTAEKSPEKCKDINTLENGIKSDLEQNCSKPIVNDLNSKGEPNEVISNKLNCDVKDISKQNDSIVPITIANQDVCVSFCVTGKTINEIPGEYSVTKANALSEDQPKQLIVNSTNENNQNDIVKIKSATENIINDEELSKNEDIDNTLERNAEKCYVSQSENELQTKEELYTTINKCVHNGIGSENELEVCAMADSETKAETKSNEHKKKDENIYELFAVLMHTGSAKGGHYFAYIKSLESKKWFCFNDRSVTSVDSSEITNAFGGSKISGSTTRSSNAYMLKYRRIVPEKNVNFVENCSIPEQLNATAEKYLPTERDTNYSSKPRNMMRTRIWYRPLRDDNVDNSIAPRDENLPLKMVRVYTFANTTIKELTAEALERLKMNTPTKLSRIVKFDEALKTIEYSFEDEEVCLGDLLEENCLHTFLLEIKAPGTQFVTYHKNRLSTPVYKVDISNKQITDYKLLTLSKEDTLETFKKAIAFEFMMEEPLDVMLDVPQQMPVLLVGNDTTLKDLDCSSDARYFVTNQIDYNSTHYILSDFYKFVSKLKSSVHILIQLPPLKEDLKVDYTEAPTDVKPSVVISDPDALTFTCPDPLVLEKNVKRSVYFVVDTGLTYQEIRALLTPLCNAQQPSDLKISTFNPCASTQYNEILSYKQTLDEGLCVALGSSQYFSMLELEVELTENLSEDDVKGKIYLLELEKDTYSGLLELTVNKNLTIGEVKKIAVERFKEMYGIQLQYDMFRLRRKLERCLSDVLSDKEILDNVMKGKKTWSFCLQQVSSGQRLYSNTVNGLFIFYKRYRPSDTSLDPVKELFLPNGTDEDFTSQVVAATGIPIESLEVSLGSTRFPCEVNLYKLNRSANWNAASRGIGWWSTGILSDGHVVYVRDKTEAATSVDATDKNNSGSQSNYQRSYSYTVEKPLKIFISEPAVRTSPETDKPPVEHRNKRRNHEEKSCIDSEPVD